MNISRPVLPEQYLSASALLTGDCSSLIMRAARAPPAPAGAAAPPVAALGLPIGVVVLGISTWAPSRRRSAPSITTVSPGFRPCVTDTFLASPGPTVLVRCDTVLS